MVAEIDKDKTLQNLARLKPEELREVLSRTQFLLGTTGTNEAPAETNDDALQTLYGAFSDAMKAADGSKPLPLVSVLRSNYGGRFRKIAVALDRLTREDFRAVRHEDRIKVARLVVGLAAEAIQAKGLTVGLRTLVSFLASPVAVVESSFPFYRASGLLPKLVKLRTVK